MRPFKIRATTLWLAAAATLVAGCGGGTGDPAADGAGGGRAYGGRDQIRVVGSSTVYPFTTIAAEHFGRSRGFKTPVIESTGTGGGFKLFCAGVGTEYPDVTNASRAIKGSETELCRGNGIDRITEIKIGFDGIVLANARQSPRLSITLRQLFLALARQVPQGDAPGKLVDNPYTRWSEIDRSLPAVEIEVLGPPPTSGTRDAFVELAMEAGCKGWDWIAALKDSDAERFEQVCHAVREDGRFVEAGENDNLIVQKLVANSDAFGIFGFSFLDQNRDKIQGSVIEGVEPTFEAIAAQQYPVSRPLYIYVKDAHVGVIPGIAEFVTEYTSEQAMGENGYLADAGLIPLPPDQLDETRRAAAELTAQPTG
jgi:phosphate transport system substrate-binding protein